MSSDQQQILSFPILSLQLLWQLSVCQPESGSTARHSVLQSPCELARPLYWLKISFDFHQFYILIEFGSTLESVRAQSYNRASSQILLIRRFSSSVLAIQLADVILELRIMHFKMRGILSNVPLSHQGLCLTVVVNGRELWSKMTKFSNASPSL